jgi:glycosyltransferase involved in cell wall biosynthesis
MNSSLLISVVIPTYNRCGYLLKILQKLKRNFLSFRSFEIIICDSYSKDNTATKVCNFRDNNLFLRIQYLNIRQNINSIKRNIGLKYAKGKYIIFLDDDCFPDDYFIKDYYYLLTKNKNSVYCGTIKYPKNELKKNFIRYRQSTHFIFDKRLNVLNDLLPARQILTMNMAFKKSILTKNKILFNKNFNRYGFEDYELGYRLVNKKIAIFKSHPIIYHHDERSFFSYLEKIKFLGLESMKYLIKININAAKDNNYFKLENFLLVKFLLNFIFFKYILSLVQRISIIIDKKLFYVPFIYKIAIASAYLEGCFNRKRYNNIKKESYTNNYWYK